MTEEEVRAEFARATPGTSRAELENRAYRDAARFARQIANDFDADIDDVLIRALHYMVSRSTDTHGIAGQYRTEANVVHKSGAVVYQPPPPVEVPRLVDDLVAWLREQRGKLHPAVIAAVAHAELVNIHPFDDGNGLTARAMTKYFLERGGWRLRGLVSSEQVFGEDIEAYYAELRAFGPRYHGQVIDLTWWVKLFTRGLYTEAVASAFVAEDYPRLLLASFAEDGIVGRLADGAAEVVIRGSISRGEYASALSVSAVTASHDLALLTARGSVRREG